MAFTARRKSWVGRLSRAQHGGTARASTAMDRRERATGAAKSRLRGSFDTGSDSLLEMVQGAIARNGITTTRHASEGTELIEQASFVPLLAALLDAEHTPHLALALPDLAVLQPPLALG